MAAQALGHRLLRRLLSVRPEARVNLPVGGIVVADVLAKELPQVLLCVAGARIRRLRSRRDVQPRLPRGPLVLGADVSLGPHARQHDPAARDRPLRVAPGRERRRRADQAGHEDALGQAQVPRPLLEEAARHRLHPVQAAAQADPIQVQLEDLVLGEHLLQHHREDRLPRLASQGAPIGKEQGARELLGQGAAPLRQPALLQVVEGRPRDGNGVDAGVSVEAMVLDGDHGVAKVGGDLFQAHVPAMLVQREPGLAVGSVEHGVADPSGQAVDREVVLAGPEEAVEAEQGGRQGDGEGDAFHRGGATDAGDEAAQHAARSLAER